MEAWEWVHQNLSFENTEFFRVALFVLICGIACLLEKLNDKASRLEKLIQAKFDGSPCADGLSEKSERMTSVSCNKGRSYRENLREHPSEEKRGGMNGETEPIGKPRT